MAWRDDFRVAYDAAQVSWPVNYLLAWAEAEHAGSNNYEEKPLPGNERGEVGWFQIDPREADKLGIDIDHVKMDPVYSIQSGAQVLDMYAAKIPSSYLGTAWWGMVKLWHGLPTLAKMVQDGVPSAGSWQEVYDWIQANVTGDDIKAISGVFHDPMKRADQVSRVLASAGDLPEAGTVGGIGPITAIVIAGIFILAVGAIVILA